MMKQRYWFSRKRDMQKKPMAKPFVWQAVVVVLSLVFVTHVKAQLSADDIFENAMYQRTYKGIPQTVSADRLDFIIDNFTYLVDILLQTDPQFFRNNFDGKFFSYDVSGPPENFIVTSFNNSAKVKMQRVSEEEVIYTATVETRKLKIPVSGDVAIKLRINREEESENKLPNLDLSIAFKPQSMLLGVAMKPVLMIFSSQVHTFIDKIFTSTDAFFLSIDTVVHKALTNKNIIYLLSSLYQENQRLIKKIDQMPEKLNTMENLQETNPAQDVSSRFIVGSIIVSLFIGLGVGFFAHKMIVHQKTMRQR